MLSMTSTIRPYTRELWNALLSCDAEAIQSVLSNDKSRELQEGCEALVPSNFIWQSEIKDELSALHYVAMIGDIDVLYDMIWRFKGLNLDGQSAYFKWTPLHYAIYGGHENIIKLLLKNGASTNIQDGDGESGLHLAVSRVKVTILKLLIRHGAKVNVQDKKGDTPLHLCFGLLGTATKGISDDERLKMTQLLVQGGASVSLMNNLGDTVMHFCLRYKHGAIFCRMLLDVPGGLASLRVTNDMGHIPLQVAEEQESMEMLLQKGSRIDFQGPDGRTTLHMRARQSELVTLLLDYKADVNIVDKQGRTALHVALSDELTPLESICHLMMSMSDINIRDNGGNAPLHLACQIKQAIRGTTDQIIDLLINQGARVNLKNNNGETPLFIAVRYSNYHKAAGLLHAGASPHLSNNKGVTPLTLDPRWAAKMGTTLINQEENRNKLHMNSVPVAKSVSINHNTEIRHSVDMNLSLCTNAINLDEIWKSSNGENESPHQSHNPRPEVKLPQVNHVRSVRTVRKQLANLQGEVTSFKSILEKCADPNKQLTDDDLLTLIDDETPNKTVESVPEDIAYLRKEVLSLAQVLEGAYLNP